MEPVETHLKRGRAKGSPPVTPPESYKFYKQSQFGWTEWTGFFKTEEEARAWYEHPKKGEFWRSKGYVFALYKNAILIHVDWL